MISIQRVEHTARVDTPTVVTLDVKDADHAAIIDAALAAAGETRTRVWSTALWRHDDVQGWVFCGATERPRTGLHRVVITKD